MTEKATLLCAFSMRKGVKIYVGHRINKYYLLYKDKTEVKFTKEMLDEILYGKLSV